MTLYTSTIYGNPITKKNSQRIVTVRGRAIIMPSAQYKKYEAAALRQLPPLPEPISEPCTVTCLYWTETARKVDLTNLLEATHDILVKAGILEDDNCSVVVSVDGSRVMGKDKENPRTEITIERITES